MAKFRDCQLGWHGMAECTIVDIGPSQPDKKHLLGANT